MRSEDDLRAAFELAAEDAPQARDVQSRLRATGLRGRRASRIWAPIAAVAVVLAVVVGISVLVAHNPRHRGSPSAGSAVGGPVAGPVEAASQQPKSTVAAPAESGYPTAGHVCRPDEVTLVMIWRGAARDLQGVLTATNHTAAPCDLLVEPVITPLSPGGAALVVPNVASSEQAVGPQRLLPGASATSAVSWTDWCSTPLGSTVRVQWGAGTAVAPVKFAGVPVPIGLCQTKPSPSMTAGWFTPLS